MRKNHFKRIISLIVLLIVCLACVTVGCTMPHPNYGGETTDGVTTDSATTDGETIDIPKESDTEKITDDEVRSMQAVIDENMDIIVSDLDALKEKVKAENRSLTLRDCIDAHPKEFDTITAYGEAALPHLESIWTQDLKLYEWRSHMALCASYLIKPSLYDKVVVSPDQRFEVRYSLDLNTWVWGLDLGSQLYPYIELMELATGNNVILYDGETCDIDVDWSSDCTYVAISHGYAKAVTKTFFYNTMEQTIVNLPSSDEIKNMLYGDETTLLEEFKITHSYIDKWEDDHTVVIGIAYWVQLPQSSKLDMKMTTYVYDLHKKEIVNLREFNLFDD